MAETGAAGTAALPAGTNRNEQGGETDERPTRSDTGGPLRQGLQRPPGRGPVRRRPAAGAPGLRREERLPRSPRVRGRGRERTHRRPAPVHEDAGRGQQAGVPIQGNPRLEILTLHPQAGARRRLQVHAAQARRPRRLHHRAGRRHPTGKLLEAIIESVDEFYSENLAQEVTRGMREAASRGFWVTSYAPYGYKRVHVQDGPKKRRRWN